MAELRCPHVRFYSPKDEACFFEWAQSIPNVKEVYGHLHDIVLVLRTNRLSNESFRELLALFYRYKVPMAQLAPFESDRNSKWLRSKEAYWYEGVFGSNG